MAIGALVGLGAPDDLLGFLLLDIAIDDDDVRNDFSKQLGLLPGSDTDVAKATLAFFDILYTFPLLFTPRDRNRSQSLDWRPFTAWWALVSSGIIAVILTYILTYAVFPIFEDGANEAFWSGIIANIISDYWAVLVIRKWLDTEETVPGKDGATPKGALLFALSAGLLLVISFTGFRLILFMTSYVILNSHFPDCGACQPSSGKIAGSPYFSMWDSMAVQNYWPVFQKLHLPGVLAASIVHFWLPAFAFIAYGFKFLNIGLKLSFFDRHPVLAFGIIAGAVIDVPLLLAELLVKKLMG
jgi:hypothetical protein